MEQEYAGGQGSARDAVLAALAAGPAPIAAASLGQVYRVETPHGPVALKVPRGPVEHMTRSRQVIW